MQLLPEYTKEAITSGHRHLAGLVAKPAKHVTYRKCLRKVFYTPETQKTLKNQGFEYGGSVEIRTLG
ncbi:TPA: hypothetical protein ACKP22_001499 [Pseudomonas putida]